LSPDISDRDPEICRWWKVTRILRVYVRILRTLFPDIPDIDSETPILAETLSKILFWSGFCGSQVFVWVHLSTGSKLKPADQSPSW
jgi:hypothetical protein